MAERWTGPACLGGLIALIPGMWLYGLDLGPAWLLGLVSAGLGGLVGMLACFRTVRGSVDRIDPNAAWPLAIIGLAAALFLVSAWTSAGEPVALGRVFLGSVAPLSYLPLPDQTVTETVTRLDLLIARLVDSRRSLDWVAWIVWVACVPVGWAGWRAFVGWTGQGRIDRSRPGRLIAALVLLAVSVGLLYGAGPKGADYRIISSRPGQNLTENGPAETRLILEWRGWFNPGRPGPACVGVLSSGPTQVRVNGRLLINLPARPALDLVSRPVDLPSGSSLIEIRHGRGDGRPGRLELLAGDSQDRLRPIPPRLLWADRPGLLAYLQPGLTFLAAAAALGAICLAVWFGLAGRPARRSTGARGAAPSPGWAWSGRLLITAGIAFALTGLLGSQLDPVLAFGPASGGWGSVFVDRLLSGLVGSDPVARAVIPVLAGGLIPWATVRAARPVVGPVSALWTGCLSLAATGLLTQADPSGRTALAGLALIWAFAKMIRRVDLPDRSDLAAASAGLGLAGLLDPWLLSPAVAALVWQARQGGFDGWWLKKTVLPLALFPVIAAGLAVGKFSTGPAAPAPWPLFWGLSVVGSILALIRSDRPRAQLAGLLTLFGLAGGWLAGSGWGGCPAVIPFAALSAVRAIRRAAASPLNFALVAAGTILVLLILDFETARSFNGRFLDFIRYCLAAPWPGGEAG